MIELKLDTNALTALIEKDETFKLSLQSAVIANITDRYLKGTAVSDLRAAIERAGEEERKAITAEYLTISRNNWGSVTCSLNPKVATEVKAAFHTMADAEIAAFKTDLTTKISQAVESYVSQLDVQINRFVATAIDKKIKETVAEQLKKKMEVALKQLTS